jgi:hypothetical protein
MPSGGWRPGAGRPKGATSKNKKAVAPKVAKTTRAAKKVTEAALPPEVKVEAEKNHLTPLEYMLEVINDQFADPKRRDQMASVAAPYVHERLGEGKGKKETREERAKAAGAGKFAPAAPPKLSVVK